MLPASDTAINDVDSTRLAIAACLAIVARSKAFVNNRENRNCQKKRLLFFVRRWQKQQIQWIHQLVSLPIHSTTTLPATRKLTFSTTFWPTSNANFVASAASVETTALL